MKRSLDFCLQNVLGSEVQRANMAANPPETRIPPTTAGWFLQCRPVLNPQKDVFAVRICPSALGDHMLSQKLLVEVGVYTFASENKPSAA
jgi:hypothetical protein